MSSSTTPPSSSPIPTDTPSSPTDSNTSPDNDPDTDGPASPTQYNYFLLLLALVFLLLFLCLLALQRRRKLRNARLQQHGRAALVQDVSRFSSGRPAIPITAGLWSWRSTHTTPACQMTRMYSTCAILEAGLDPRGDEAPPPPYSKSPAGTGDKEGSLTTRTRMTTTTTMIRDQHLRHGENDLMPCRPDTEGAAVVATTTTNTTIRCPIPAEERTTTTMPMDGEPPRPRISRPDRRRWGDENAILEEEQQEGRWDETTEVPAITRPAEAMTVTDRPTRERRR